MWSDLMMTKLVMQERQCLPPTCAHTRARNWACHWGTCPRPELNPHPFSPQATALTAEPNWLGQFSNIIHWSFGKYWLTYWVSNTAAFYSTIYFFKSIFANITTDLRRKVKNWEDVTFTVLYMFAKFLILFSIDSLFKST